MKRVTGIGGLFFKCENADHMKQWYKDHLGIETDQYGGCFEWHKKDGSTGHTVWSTFEKESNYFAPSTKDFMFNYRVEDLEKLLEILLAEGVEQIGQMEVFDYGKFAWIMDPEGNKIELWQPLEFESIITTKQEMS